MKFATKLHALLSTARIANVPSVVSNLGVGVLLGSIGAGPDFSWPWLLSLAAILFYISGNFLNDWADCEWDKSKRPERALPQGLFPKPAYLATTIAGAVIGLALTAAYGLWALFVAAVLVWLIWLYTKVHKKAAWSVIPMGLCRACLPLLGYVAMRGSFAGAALFPAVALFIYIVALSLSARWESRPEVPDTMKLRSRALLAGAGVTAAVLPILLSPPLGWIGLLPFGIWLALCLTKFAAPVPVHVSALLAGIPLLDWVMLLPMAFLWLRQGRVDASDPMFLIALLMPPTAFVLGRAMQRLAPAT
jgi:4-hydroxybenzoate polyprenyltransferase